jgi:hypothetical protein
MYSPPSWYSAASPAAFGTKPAPVQPQPTAPAAVGTAMGLGNQVYGQLPGYQQSLGNIGANIQSETAGQLPADVTEQITNEAAARGVASGTGADEVNQNLLKTLGLTSLNLTQMGQQGLDQQLGLLPGAGLYQNPAYYPTTGQTYEAGVQNNLNAAAPDPFAAANAAIGAARAGYGAGGGGTSMLPPTPNNGPTSSVIPGVPLGGTLFASGSGDTGNLGWLTALAKQYDPNSPAGSETATTPYEQQQAEDTLGSLEDLYPSAGGS